ncbi:MAG: LuxR C-terminal-related transcriptional regulator, partial [Clostridia bacterium]|nr:LuxR C-terminal-related transcriptional regulator [Clostridia bacterium]
ASYYNLTRRELEIVNLITKGYTNKEISNILYVSTHTVRTHVFNIFKKMDVNNRTAISNKIAEVM